MASNISSGTRGLSAGDWVRLQRLRGARTYVTNDLDLNRDVVVPTQPQVSYSQAMLIPRTTGGSKIRRPASNWTEYKASQTSDFILQSQNPTNPNAKRLETTRLCDCTTTGSGDYDGAIGVGTNITVTLPEKAYKLYTFTPPQTGTYTITAFSVESSDPDVFVSYPDGNINIPLVIEENDVGSLRGEGVLDTVLYANNTSNTSAISGYFQGGRRYQVMIQQYEGTEFMLTLEARVYDATVVEFVTNTLVSQDEGEYKLYKWTPASSGNYIIEAASVGGSDPNIFVSYPSGGINTAYVIAEGEGDSTVDIENTSAGTSSIDDNFIGGQTYEIMVYQSGGSDFQLIVTD